MVALPALLVQSAVAQVMGPAVPAGTLDAGIMYREIRRSFEGESDWYINQSGYSIVFRYGLTQVATFSAELSGDQDWFGFSDDYATYTVGGGLQSTIWTHEPWMITSAIHFTRLFELDQEPPGQGTYDEVSLDWTLLCHYPLQTRLGVVTPWLGPALSYFKVVPQYPNYEDEYEADRFLGAAFGIELVSRHAVLAGYGLWIDEFQPRLMVAYRF